MRHGAVVQVTDCKHDGCLLDFHSVKWILLIFLFLRSGLLPEKAKKGKARRHHHSTRSASKIRQ